MIKDMPHYERPMEKLLSFGPSSLTDSELIANIIRSGVRGYSALELAREILRRYDNNITNIKDCNIEEFIELEGIGEVKACQLLSAIELGKRIMSPPDIRNFKLCSPTDVVDFFQSEFGSENVEKFIVVSVSSKNIVLNWDVVSIGLLNASLVHPREVFRSAIKRSAYAIIAIHNHPSGFVEPSVEDRLVTKRLSETGELMGIKLLDHIIIAKNAYYSFKEHGDF